MSLLLATIAGCARPQQQSSGFTPALSLQPIHYTRTGGLAGTNDRLIVSPDGTAVVTGPIWGNRSGRLSPEQIAALATAFDGWDRVRSHYPALPGVTDAFGLSLTYGGKTVTATDVSDLPETFKWAQTLLDELARQLPPVVPSRPGPTTSSPAPPTSRSDPG